MKKVETGHFVKVDYTGKLDNGEVFHSTQNAQPVEIEVGAGRLIKGFEDALVGMAQNEKKSFDLTAEEGFGPRDENMMQTFNRSDLPGDFQPKIGDVVALSTPQGGQVPAKVKEMDDEKITVDLNHPLAGQDLSFDVEIIEINEEATEQPACTPSSCGGGCACS
jgi:peptidylprolyl isomerase